MHKQKEELEQDASKFEYTQGETLKEFFQRCEELRSQLIMQNIRLGEDEEKFMELIMQALESHSLANEFNTIFVGSECSSFERLKKLLNTATLRASKRIPNRDINHKRFRQTTHQPIQFTPCSFHSRHGQRCNHSDSQYRDPRNRNGPHYDPSHKGPTGRRTDNNRNENTEIKSILKALLQDKQKPTPAFKRPHKKGANVANSAAAREWIAELNDHIAKLEDEQDDENDTEGKFILDSACHPSNVPSSNSLMTKLTHPTTTITADNRRALRHTRRR